MQLVLLIILGLVVLFVIISVIAMFLEMATKRRTGKMHGNQKNQVKKRKK